MNWKTELILNAFEIVSIKIEHMLFIDSVSYLPMPLRKLPLGIRTFSNQTVVYALFQ